MFPVVFKDLVNEFVPFFKIKLVLVTLFAIFSGFLELMGILLIFPFLKLILSPDALQSSPLGQMVMHYLSVESPELMVPIIGFSIAIIFTMKNLFMFGFLAFQNNFLKDFKIAINNKLLKVYLSKKYEYFLNKKYSEIIRNLEALSVNVVNNFVLSIVNLIVQSFIALSVFVFFAVKFFVPTFVASVFIVAVAIIYNYIFKKIFARLGEQEAEIRTAFLQKSVELFKNIKQVKVSGKEQKFLEDVNEIDSERIGINTLTITFHYAPSHIIEIITLLTILIVCGFIFANENLNSASIVSILGMFAAATLRLTPVFAKILSSLNRINNTCSHAKILLDECKRIDENNVDEVVLGSESMSFDSSLVLNNLSYSYPSTPDKLALADVNLEVRKGEFVGIVGASGAGKTTLIDVTMGLLSQCSGEILVDGKEITASNLLSWQSKISYVSQEVNLNNDTLKKNIAFGVCSDDIDERKVSDCLKQAQLYDFVQTLKYGIDTELGELGLKLSEGQKQRVLIARALYSNPEVIILDEATSALDVSTENEFTQVIDALKGQKTIIAIAHRLSTLKNCDKIIYMGDAEILDVGDFGYLSGNYPEFEKMLKLSKVES